MLADIFLVDALIAKRPRAPGIKPRLRQFGHPLSLQPS